MKKSNAKNKKRENNVIKFERNPEVYFRVGTKHIDKKSFDQALKYLSKAVELEPFNADYQFNLACVYSEIKEPKKSNGILTDILKNIDPTLTECYFGLGCNHFDMGNIKKAREFFEKYIYFDPEGQFADETYDILYYLQIYDDVGVNSKKSNTVSKLSVEGKDLLFDGDYDKACSKLEKAIELNPEATTPRNYLSLSYFFKGQLDKAISLAKSVLKLQPKNVYANCNLALFYGCTNKTAMYEKQIRALLELDISDKEDFLKLLYTYRILKRHSDIVRLLVGYLKDSRDPLLFQMLSIAFFNLNQFENAKDVWDAMYDLFPQFNLLVDYYSKLNNDTKNGVIEFKHLDYLCKLPDDLDAEYRGKLEASMQLDPAMFKKIWKRDSILHDIISFYLFEGSNDLRSPIVEKLIQIKSSEIKSLLKGILEDETAEGGLKKIIAGALGIGGYEVEEKPEVKIQVNDFCDLRDLPLRWKKEWQAVIDCALEKKEFIYKGSYKNELRKILINYFKRLYPGKVPVVKKSETWAAALEYLYCNMHLIKVSKSELARKYKISASSITNKLKDFIR